MSLTAKEVAQLKKIIAVAEQLISGAGAAGGARAAAGATKSVKNGRRRTGKDLENFRKMLKQERKSGASVAALAKKHGVTPSYIYQIG